MKIKFFSAQLLLLLLIFPLLVFSQTYGEKIKEIDAYAEKVRKDWNVPGMAVAIVKDDKVIFVKGYGVRELGKADPVDEETLFAVASNSKAFTTAALAILADEGKLNWDDKVVKHLPEFELADPYVTREMTIRDLVSHRSGFDTFSGDLLWYETTLKDDEILKRLRYLKPKTSFRSTYGYQNLMFIAAGKIVERVSGATWSDFVTRRILSPLKMNQTTTSVNSERISANAQQKAKTAMPHNESGGKLRVLHRGNVDGATAAAGLNSSAAEMANWLRLQLGRGKYEGKQVFSEKQSWEMWQQNTAIPISQAGAKFIPSRHFNGYGLGWFLWDYHGRKVVSHGGGLDGMISETAMMPEENLGLVVLTNSETPVNVIMQNKIFDVFVNAPKRDWSAEYLTRAKAGKTAETEEQKKIESSRIKNTKTSLALKDYAGTYSGALYGDVTVAEENGKLVLRMLPSPNFVADLEHWHYDTFRIRWRPTVAYNFPTGFVTFTIDKNGKPDEIKIDQPNNDFWFYELELKRSK